MTAGPGFPDAGNPGYAVTPSGRAQMRVSTSDRDHAVDLLTKAFAEGRIDKDEHDARVGRAMAATTFADLDTLVADLPAASPPYPGPAQQGGWAYPVAAARTNALAITSMVCGIAQFFGFWLLAAIPAVVCGHIARRQIRQTGEQGAGMALAGLILGWAGVGLTVLAALIVAIVLFAVAGSGTGP